MAVNPVLVYISTYAVKAGYGQSVYATHSFANTAGYDAVIPIKVITPSGVSAGTEVYVYRSTDGGDTYETEATLYAIFPRKASSTMVKDLVLRDPGIYQVRVLVGGGSSATWSVDFGATIQLTTSYA